MVIDQLPVKVLEIPVQVASMDFDLFLPFILAENFQFFH